MLIYFCGTYYTEVFLAGVNVFMSVLCSKNERPIKALTSCDDINKCRHYSRCGEQRSLWSRCILRGLPIKCQHETTRTGMQICSLINWQSLNCTIVFSVGRVCCISSAIMVVDQFPLQATMTRQTLSHDRRTMQQPKVNRLKLHHDS